MQTKPKVIDLKQIHEEYTIRESEHTINLSLYTEESKRYADIIRKQSHIEIRGAGVRNNGVYYVENVSHQKESGRYKITFKLRKNKI